MGDANEAAVEAKIGSPGGSIIDTLKGLATLLECSPGSVGVAIIVKFDDESYDIVSTMQRNVLDRIIWTEADKIVGGLMGPAPVGTSSEEK